MLVKIDLAQIKVGALVCVPIIWGGKNRTADGEITRISECQRFVAVRYSYHARNFVRHYRADQLQIRVDGRNKKAVPK